MIFIVGILSFIFTYGVKWFAQKREIVDVPNERSSHVTATPRGGGLAIVMVWFAAISYLNYTGDINPNLYYALMSGVLIGGVSLLDDIYTLKLLPRILIQSISSLIALYFIGGLTQVDLGFMLIENTIFLNAIAFIGIIWFINLFNFIDGIDGYAAMEAIFIALALFFFVTDNLLLVLAMAVLGFLPWNWSKAKIFMGDIGSTSLGFTVAVLIIYYNNEQSFPILNSLILTSIFWFDATLTLIKRFMNGEKIGQAHKKHAFQRIVQFGFSHQKTVIIAILLNIGLFLIVAVSQHYSAYMTFFLGVVILLLYLLYRFIGTKKPFN